MSLSSAPSSLSDSSSSQSDTLLQNEIIKEDPKDTLQQLADALPQSADALPHSTDSPSSLLLHENTRTPIPLHSRSAGRDVHIFDTHDRNTSIGGLILTAGVTNANLYAMIEIFVIFNGEYIIRNESDIMIEKNDSILLPGNYYINSPCINEMPLTRMVSQCTGTRVKAFADAVRSRDRRCVITRRVAINADRDKWTGFEAAHIFPLAFEGLWKEYNYGRWIKSPSNGEEIKGGKINSVQNGLLLSSDIHQLFDMYEFSINPDDNYKIVCFDRDGHGIAGNFFDQRPLDDPQRPADQLLRWHFRQAVLVNIKGAGEPIFEHDFPPGSDIMGSILQGPKAARRMEFELFSRLATQFDLTK
ncbi:HNH endonuclease-domain-containing protein [Tricladium varicosporioides]|nr:HNH endonuclease-domain-containing protein [Hymenoscyphus varicosporioides]